jgi:uncharacterized protein (TIGR02594 family)
MRWIVFALAVLFVQPAQAKTHRHHVVHHVRHHVVHHVHAVRHASRRHVVSFSERESIGGADTVSAAARYMGGNPTGWRRAWCARFANLVLAQLGYRQSGSNLAIDFLRYGRPSGPIPGSIAVLRHHVGFVSRAEHGRVLILSGNHRHRVGVGWYPASVIVGYRAPI